LNEIATLRLPPFFFFSFFPRSQMPFLLGGSFSLPSPSPYLSISPPGQRNNKGHKPDFILFFPPLLVSIFPSTARPLSPFLSFPIIWTIRSASRITLFSSFLCRYRPFFDLSPGYCFLPFPSKVECTGLPLSSPFFLRVAPPVSEQATDPFFPPLFFLMERGNNIQHQGVGPFSFLSFPLSPIRGFPSILCHILLPPKRKKEIKQADGTTLSFVYPFFPPFPSSTP